MYFLGEILKRIFFITYLILICLLIESCGSMRSPNSTPKSSKSSTKSKSNNKNISSKDENPNEKNEEYVRFKDTLTVVLPPVMTFDKTQSIDNDFDKAVNDFENREYDSACERIEVYTGIFTQTDSLYFEAKYYLCECYIIKGNANKAIEILNGIINDDNLTESVRERVLVRLGQLYCLVGNKLEAENLFSRLKKQYPNSIYLPYANCDKIK